MDVGLGKRSIVTALAALILLLLGIGRMSGLGDSTPESPSQVVAVSDTVPAEAEALFKYLQAGSYKSFAHEAAKHRSKGPHPTPEGAAKAMVFTYFNSQLDQSLKAGGGTHPKGSAAVKEFYDDSDQLIGWAVSVKTADDSQTGQGWFWYEVLSTTDGSNPVAAANGVPLCFGCHQVGRDFVLSQYPPE